ncbi:MAG: CAP domain-containing protein [Chloroflexi bacterium]|nr:CAP domain-containing protein [Chloroflexota bacterium]
MEGNQNLGSLPQRERSWPWRPGLTSEPATSGTGRRRPSSRDPARNNASPADSPGVAHQGFMNSPTHAQNELDPSFNKVGIGAAVTGDGTIYFTELFAALD